MKDAQIGQQSGEEQTGLRRHKLIIKGISAIEAGEMNAPVQKQRAERWEVF